MVSIGGQTQSLTQTVMVSVGGQIQSLTQTVMVSVGGQIHSLTLNSYGECRWPDTVIDSDRVMVSGVGGHTVIDSDRVVVSIGGQTVIDSDRVMVSVDGHLKYNHCRPVPCLAQVGFWSALLCLLLKSEMNNVSKPRSKKTFLQQSKCITCLLWFLQILCFQSVQTSRMMSDEMTCSGM